MSTDQNPLEVLIIEDLKVAQLAAQSIFDRLNCQVTVVGTGVAALNQIMVKHFDMIFLDIELPDMDGFEITTTIRSLERHHHIPIVAVTAHTYDNFDVRCHASGLDDFIYKPLTIEGVRYMLNKHVSRKTDLEIDKISD
jgi:CheY-like chemotaxis protein